MRKKYTEMMNFEEITYFLHNVAKCNNLEMGSVLNMIDTEDSGTIYMASTVPSKKRNYRNDIDYYIEVFNINRNVMLLRKLTVLNDDQSFREELTDISTQSAIQNNNRNYVAVSINNIKNYPIIFDSKPNTFERFRKDTMYKSDKKISNVVIDLYTGKVFPFNPGSTVSTPEWFNNNVIELDAQMLFPIEFLKYHGLETRYCCAGHEMEVCDGHLTELAPYIIFENSAKNNTKLKHIFRISENNFENKTPSGCWDKTIDDDQIVYRCTTDTSYFVQAVFGKSNIKFLNMLYFDCNIYQYHKTILKDIN